MRAFRRLPDTRFAADWVHHAIDVARMNNGSFGATPLPVLQAESTYRAQWRANPDAFYFALGAASLDSQLQAASDAAAAALTAPAGSVCLVENATVATSIIANRWAKAIRKQAELGMNQAIMLLDVGYKACAYSMAAICEPAGAALHFSSVPFPETSVDGILKSLDATLSQNKPRFAFLDHVSSQPALVLPIRDMIALCRAHGVEEIAVDGAHGAGLLSPMELDVQSMGADFYFTNLHKVRT